jgi:isocitrate dehydrogenase
LDGTPDVTRFADLLERAALGTVGAGIMTGDLLTVARKSAKNRQVSTVGFIDAIASRLEQKIRR